MTPAEFAGWTVARTKEKRDAWFRLAWQTAWLLKPYSKGRITPDKLLGRDTSAAGVTIGHDPADLKKELEIIRTEWDRRVAAAAELKLQMQIRGELPGPTDGDREADCAPAVRRQRVSILSRREAVDDDDGDH